MKLSVIIPAFNAEKYIGDCIKSVANHGGQNLEIIVVNDGSTDKTESVVKKIMQEIKYVNYYMKPNGGVSSARNFGLEKALGDYVTFIDADDEVNENFNQAIQFIKDEDFVVFPYLEVKNKNTKSKRIQAGVNLNSVCFKVFNREFLINNKIKFDETLTIAEDTKFCFDCYRLTNNFKNLKIAYYLYKRNDDSAMAKLSLKKVTDLLVTCEYCAKNIEKINSKNCKQILSDNILSLIARAKILEQNPELIKRLLQLEKFVNYGSTLKKKMVVAYIKVFGLNKAVKYFCKRGL